MVIKPIIPIWIMIIICLIGIIIIIYDEQWKNIKKITKKYLINVIIKISILILLFIINLRPMIFKEKNISKEIDRKILFVIDTSVSMKALDYNNDEERINGVINDCCYIVDKLSDCEFSIITFGIYGIYWMIKINDEVNTLAGETSATTGGMVFLFSLITCGIYGLYWQFKMGERCDKIRGVNGSSNVLYLILGILGFMIISMCLMQDTVNKRVE